MSRAITRSVVTVTALAAVTGAVSPGAAVAASSDAVAQAVGIGTTDVQRVEAAAAVRLDPTADVLLLSDYDFIHAIWQKARDAGELLDSVRTAAEQAMGSTLPEDHVQFIVTGIHEAHQLDQQREREKAEAERAARYAKSQALLAIGIPSTPELLALSDDNFVRAIAKHSASGPEVRSAALLALVGEAADWREFIVNGAREAHKRDVANELAELEEQDRKEAERRAELAARTSTAALFRMAPTEAMLNLSADNFIRELLRSAPVDLLGTELYAEGQRAVLSTDAADWKEYIHTGAEAAYKRDDAARQAKLAEANRKLALQIQAAAENSGVNPNLVAGAKKALAGNDNDVANFLKEDTQYRLKRQSIKASSINVTGYLRQSAADGGKATLDDLTTGSTQADREDATWVIVPALASKPGCYSFESARKPGYYLKSGATEKFGFRVQIAADDRSTAFRQSATWCAGEPPQGTVGKTFTQTIGSTQHWLSPTTGDIYANKSWMFIDAAPFRSQATWRIVSPLAP